MLFLHHRCVENDVVSEFLLRPPHVVGHSFEHLEAEAVLRGVVEFCQQVGVGDGEKVVGCHADMEHLRILWLEATFDDMQVVGIHLSLVGSHRIRPSAHVAHDVLHVEVAAFHDAHLDGCATLFHAFAGKLQKFRLESPSIGQVGLHHDARLIVLELWQ